MEGHLMGGRLRCSRYEPKLDDLLADEVVMMPVLRSAGLDRREFRELMAETAKRLGDRGRWSDDPSAVES
jgi:hypothetical protein